MVQLGARLVGSLGIIYSLVVEVVPQYDLVSTREEVDWGEMKARLKTGNPFGRETRGVQVVINPYPRGTVRALLPHDPNGGGRERR